jgi:hypothetical protein
MLKYSTSTPFVPQSWGNIGFGGHPQTPGRRFPAPLFGPSPSSYEFDDIAEYLCVFYFTRITLILTLRLSEYLSKLALS